MEQGSTASRKFNLSRCAKRFLGLCDHNGKDNRSAHGYANDSTHNNHAGVENAEDDCEELKSLLTPTLIAADLNAIFSTAQLKAIHVCLAVDDKGEEEVNDRGEEEVNDRREEQKECSHKPKSSHKPIITKAILIEAIQATKPSFSASDVTKYDKLYEGYRSEEGKSDAVKSKIAEIKSGKQRTMLG
jgi:hypothetical protein